jgi:hypothetical protein
MKQRKVSTDSDPGPRLQRLNEYLERNFPDFFAAARFQVGDDDYFLYARFGQYLVRVSACQRQPGAISRACASELGRLRRRLARRQRQLQQLRAPHDA